MYILKHRQIQANEYYFIRSETLIYTNCIDSHFNVGNNCRKVKN